MSTSLLQILESSVDEINKTRKRPIDKSDFINVRLYGAGAVFDSMQLVNFLVLVEQRIADTLDQFVSLTSEKAVSMRVSPFSSVRTLLQFIESELALAANGEASTPGGGDAVVGASG